MSGAALLVVKSHVRRRIEKQKDLPDFLVSVPADTRVCIIR